MVFFAVQNFKVAALKMSRVTGFSQVALWFVAAAFRKKTKSAETVRRRALSKTKKNIIAGKEICPLSAAENRSLYLDCPFKTTHWIDPKKISHGLYWSQNRGHLIVYDSVGRLYPFARHSTSVFIRELILEKKHLEETTLYKAMSRGFARKVIISGKPVRIPLNTHDNMLLYLDKCQSLISSIQAYGFEWSKDKNIGLTITSEGEIAHFRCGHHRLAIAQALGITKVPIDIELVSAKFLVERIPRRRLWSNSAMVRAVDEVLRDAVATLSQG